MDQLKYLGAKFAAFNPNANLKSDRSSTSLCPSCRSITRRKSRRCGYKWDKEYKLNQSITQLRQSVSSGCHLCCLRWNDLTAAVMVSETEMTATGKAAFTKSSMWDPHGREERVQARCHSDLLFSHEVLNHGSMGEIITESDLPYLGNPGEKDNLMGSYCTSLQSLYGPLTIRTQYYIKTNGVSWKTLRSWLVDSKEELHVSALQNENSSFLPTRLIYLRSGSVLQPKLCETHDLPKEIAYMTLSHYDADPAMLQLTVENIQHLKQLIPTQLLSQTHLDAMVLAQKLGIRYLWIDSLCIVQNSPQDSAREATMIRDVYGYTICNLAASDLVNGSYMILGGLRTDNNLDLQGLVVTIQSKPVVSHVDSGEVFGKWCEKNSIKSNDWEVQRIDLAPRILWGE